MNQNRVELISLFLEGLLPFIGYFFFDWSFVEILLFYGLDMLASEYNFILKLWYIIRKPKYFKGFDPAFRQQLLGSISVSLFTYFAANALLVWALQNYNINYGITEKLGHQISSFIMDNFFLLPLLILARHMQTNMQFIKPGSYVEAKKTMLYKTHIFHRSTLFIGLVGLVFLASYFENTIILIALMVIAKMGVDLYTYQKRKQKLWA